MYTQIDLTIPEMLTHTYLECPILDKYRIQEANVGYFRRGSLAIIESGNKLIGTPIIEERSMEYQTVHTVHGPQNIQTYAYASYTIFIDGLYHKYPESIDRIEPGEFLSNYVPKIRITEYFLEVIVEL